MRVYGAVFGGNIGVRGTVERRRIIGINRRVRGDKRLRISCKQPQYTDDFGGARLFGIFGRRTGHLGGRGGLRYTAADFIPHFVRGIFVCNMLTVAYLFSLSACGAKRRARGGVLYILGDNDAVLSAYSGGRSVSLLALSAHRARFARFFLINCKIIA